MQTLVKIEETCVELLRQGDPVTFTTVAAKAGISRTSLYRDHALRTVVEEHRLHSNDPRTMSGLVTEIGHLRIAVEALAGQVRSHEERLRRLDKINRPNRKSS
jgi:hypothetical protein